MTRVGGLLRNRDELKGVRILSDTEAVALIRDKIRERDDLNRRIAREFGGALPEWTRAD